MCGEGSGLKIADWGIADVQLRQNDQAQVPDWPFLTRHRCLIGPSWPGTGAWLALPDQAQVPDWPIQTRHRCLVGPSRPGTGAWLAHPDQAQVPDWPKQCELLEALPTESPSSQMEIVVSPEKLPVSSRTHLKSSFDQSSFKSLRL